MQLCAPAILYLGFSITHVIGDTFKQLYSVALMKLLIMVIFTPILNILCDSGLSIISWFIVFLPFIFMTIISSVLVYAFGFNLYRI